MKWIGSAVVAAAAVAAFPSHPAHAQLGLIVGYPCAKSFNAPPTPGAYTTGFFGATASCTVTAICPHPSAEFSVFAHVAAGDSCPQDQVLNSAGDSVSQILLDVDAFGSALDVHNALVRGNSYVSSACGGYSASVQNDYPQVCGVVIISRGGGGGGPRAPYPDPGCYYGFSDDGDECIG